MTILLVLIWLCSVNYMLIILYFLLQAALVLTGKWSINIAQNKLNYICKVLIFLNRSQQGLIALAKLVFDEVQETMKQGQTINQSDINVQFGGICSHLNAKEL